MDFEGLTGWLRHLVGRQPFFPYRMSFILELPARRLLITPSQLADRLHLTPSVKVLEVGCGSGVFSVEPGRLGARVTRTARLDLGDDDVASQLDVWRAGDDGTFESQCSLAIARVDLPQVVEVLTAMLHDLQGDAP